VQFEAVEPPHRALSSLSEALEDLVQMDSLVLADTQGRAIHKTDSRATSHAALLHEQDEGNGNLPLQLDKTVIGDGLWEKVFHILGYVNSSRRFLLAITKR
jgi:hypothetical protein